MEVLSLDCHVDQVFEAKTVIKLWQLMLATRVNVEQLGVPAQRSFRAKRGDYPQLSIINRWHAKVLDERNQRIKLLGVVLSQ